MKEKIIKGKKDNIKRNSIIILIFGIIISFVVFFIMVSSWKNFTINEYIYCKGEQKIYTIKGETYNYPQTTSDKEKCEELKNMNLIKFAIEDGQNSYWIALITIIFVTIIITVIYYKVSSKKGKKKITKKTISTTDELREYKKLLDDNIISQEEFDKKKKELLKK